MRVGVVGAGIVGLAIARRLGQRADGMELTVLEKELQVGAHQTGHSSGVVHAGVYYVPGSLKATLCRRGAELLAAYCDQRGITYSECGKLVVARAPGELAGLDEVERRARANGVPGLRRLEPPEMAAIEPYVRGVSALHSPRTAIVDFQAVARAYADDVRAAGGTVRLGFRVTAVRCSASEVRVDSAMGEQVAFDRLIICGGLQADRLARLAGCDPEPRVVPFRGEYHRLISERAHLVKGLIYPVPDPAYPFLGVHFTRRVDGAVDIGPNAVLALSREGYGRAAFDARDVLDTLRSPGFRRMIRRHWRMAAAQLHSSLSTRELIARARQLIPELAVTDVEPGPVGVRAQAIDPDGSLVEDFRITSSRGLVLIRNAPSPAATSSLAIAEHVTGQLAI